MSIESDPHLAEGGPIHIARSWVKAIVTDDAVTARELSHESMRPTLVRPFAFFWKLAGHDIDPEALTDELCDEGDTT